MLLSDRPSLLVVEDNLDTQILLRYLLRQAYHVTLAATVEEALDAARTHPFDLGLLDIDLGQVQTGVDLFHALRRLPGYAGVPILALTAYAMPGDRDRFLAEGFDGYISKPFTRQQLFDALAALLAVRRPDE